MSNLIQMKRGAAANVTAASLAAGEPAFDLTNMKLYIGNGTDKTVINPDNVPSATKLATVRTIAINGDMSGTATFDGTANASIATYLNPSGATAGTYKSVTVDAKGRVTAGTNPTTLSSYGITDAAPLASPAFTGTPTAPTAAAGTNTTQLATTAFVQTSIGSATVSGVGTNYIKYSNGMMICWASKNFSGQAVSTAIGSLYQSSELNFDVFPTSFYSTPVVFYESQNPGGTPVWIVQRTAASTSSPGGIYLFGAASSGIATCIVGYVAFGRWKA